MRSIKVIKSEMRGALSLEKYEMNTNLHRNMNNISGIYYSMIDTICEFGKLIQHR